VTAAEYPFTLDLGDLNGDGREDLVVGHNLNNRTSVILANTSGGFGAPSSIINLFPPLLIRLGDADGDGSLDLFYPQNGNTTIGRRLNQGDGTFGSPAVFIAGTTIARFSLGDGDGNGTLDVIAIGDLTTVSMVSGSGTGSFTASATISVPFNSKDAVVRDIDADGRADLIVGCSNPQGVVVYKNISGFTYQAEVSHYAGVQTSLLATGDFDADGDVDVAATHRDGCHSVSFTWNQGGGLFSAPIRITDTSNYVAMDVRAGDLNSDGIPDVVVANGSQASSLNRWLSRSLGAGNGTFGVIQYVVSAQLSQPQAVRLADLNGDGNLEACVASSFLAGAAIGNGTGSFPLSVTLTQSTSNTGKDLAFEDLDADGKPDMILIHLSPAKTLTIHKNTTTTTIPSFSLQGTFEVGFGPETLQVTDLNADGRKDIIVANFNSPTFSVVPGGQGFAFGVPAQVSTGTSPLSIYAFDWSGDGVKDAVTVNYGSMDLSLHPGNGLGGFGPATSIPMPARPYDGTAGDFDSDGRIDLLTTLYDNFGSTVFWAGGPGLTFQNRGLMVGGNTYFGWDTADINGDGYLDAISSGVGAIVFVNQLGHPTGVSAYGYGTSGCEGRLGLSANHSPSAPDPTFGVLTTNAPQDTLGLLMIADVADAPGANWFGVGAVIHLNPLASAEFQVFDSPSNLHGSGFTSLPIPGVPTLVGSTYHAQSLWLELSNSGQRCSTALLDIVTSNGLSLTIQP